MIDGRAATISEMWRYPVKSMRGERVEQSDVTDAGFVGDRGLCGDRSGDRQGRQREASAALGCAPAMRAAVSRGAGCGRAAPSGLDHAAERRGDRKRRSRVDEHLSAVFERPVQLTTVAPKGNAYLAVWPDDGRRHARRLSGPESGRRHRSRGNTHRSRAGDGVAAGHVLRCRRAARGHGRDARAVSASWNRRARSRSPVPARTL